MHLTVLLALITLALGATPAAAQDAAVPLGQWVSHHDDTGEPRAVIELFLDGDELQARIVDVIGSDGDACSRCQGELRGRPIEGLTILTGMTRDGDAWSGGRILDPSNGKTYRAKLWREGEALHVRGYLGPFGRTQVWTRPDVR